LQAVGGIFGNLAILREQAQSARAVLLLIENFQGLAPGRFLLVVDFTQVQDRALRRLTARQPPVLHHAEVAVLLAILLAIGGAQKHRSRRMPEKPAPWKRVGLPHSDFQISPSQAKGLRPTHPAKRLGSAKVQLDGAAVHWSGLFSTDLERNSVRRRSGGTA
jgi:hypothetical protein